MITFLLVLFLAAFAVLVVARVSWLPAKLRAAVIAFRAIVAEHWSKP